MKKLILLLCVASVGFVSCDKEDDVPKNEVPSVVLNSFETTFPTAVDIEWEKRGSNYEANFEIDRVDYSALINSSGTIEKTKYDIPNSELPEEVKTAISTNYSDKNIDDADVLEIDGKIFYQVELDGGITDTKIVFKPSGKENPEIEYWD